MTRWDDGTLVLDSLSLALAESNFLDFRTTRHFILTVSGFYRVITGLLPDTIQI